MQICDRQYHPADGSKVAEDWFSQVTTDDLALLWRSQSGTTALQRARKTTHEVLRAENLTDSGSFRDVSFLCVPASVGRHRPAGRMGQ
jgi:ABC-type sugar transport system ATPase subunit